jgi:hypothetical protein
MTPVLSGKVISRERVDVTQRKSKSFFKDAYDVPFSGDAPFLVETAGNS